MERTKVDFATVKQIPIDAVLGHYGIQTRKRNNSELVANCPFASHAEANKEHKWTLAISLDKNKWYCHSDTCRAASNKPKGGDVIDVVAMMENVTPLEAGRKLTEWFSQVAKQNGPVRLHSEKDVNEAAVERNKPLAWKYEDPVLDYSHPMIQSRGISLETARKFGVAAYIGNGKTMPGRIVFPLYEYLSDGAEEPTLIGYAGRTFLEVTPENPKWKMPPGFIKRTLYGLERCSPDKPLIVVEGCWGVLWLTQNGQQAAALLGKELTEAQEQALSPFKVLWLALDDDEPGREASKKIAERLRGKHVVKISHLRR